MSQHLAILRQAGITRTRKERTTVYYRIDNQLTKKILDLLEEY
jgi:DNA-binding transcriptional ArsR family regulator